MLVFNEGVPGSGKSYDAIKNHVLPAIKKGRRVFARLNGLELDSCRDAIAQYVGVTRERVDELLTHVATDDVRSTFVAEQGQDGKWLPRGDLKNALVVIDEVHEFYVSAKNPLPPQEEQFFAMARHTGTDVVLMTQFYKRMHTALRFRIERKNAFQKLTVLGKLGESKYTVRRFVTLKPDSYEQVGTETHRYDAKVFPCYQGIAGDDVQSEVYEGGGATVWRKLVLPAAVVIPLAVWGIFKLVGFFGGGAHFTHASKAPMTTSTMQASAPGQVIGPDAPAPAGHAATAPAPKPPTAKEIAEAKREKLLEQMTAPQRYVWALGDSSRIRYGGAIGEGQSSRGVVEWVNSSAVVVERLTIGQLRAMGVAVTVEPYGVRLAAAGAEVIATPWPLNQPLRDQRPELYNTSGADGARASAASASTASDGGSVPGTLIGAPAPPPTATFKGGA